MSTFYNLIDSDGIKTLGSFVTTLSPTTIQKLKEKTDKMSKTNQYKTEIFFELMRQHDREFKVITAEKVEL